MVAIAGRMHDAFMHWFFTQVLGFYGRSSEMMEEWLEDISERFPDDHGA